MQSHWHCTLSRCRYVCKSLAKAQSHLQAHDTLEAYARAAKHCFRSYSMKKNCPNPVSCQKFVFIVIYLLLFVIKRSLEFLFQLPIFILLYMYHNNSVLFTHIFSIWVLTFYTSASPEMFLFNLACMCRQ